MCLARNVSHKDKNIMQWGHLAGPRVKNCLFFLTKGDKYFLLVTEDNVRVKFRIQHSTN